MFLILSDVIWYSKNTLKEYFEIFIEIIERVLILRNLIKVINLSKVRK